MFVKLVVDGRCRAQFLDAMRCLLERYRVEEGCLSCRLCADIEDPDTLLLIEDWRSMEDFGKHLHGARFRALLASTEMLSVPPKYSVSTVSDRTEFENAVELFGWIAPRGRSCQL